MPESLFKITRNLFFQNTFRLLLLDEAYANSKITAVHSNINVSLSLGLSGNVTGLVPVTCRSVEDNFKDTLKKLRLENLNRFIIS